MLSVRSIPDTLIAAGGLLQVGKLARGLGAAKVFLVTDKGLTKVGVTAKVEAVLRGAKLKVEVFDDVVANPTVRVVEAGAARLRALMEDGEGGTVMVSLGGGSSMDAGKAMAMLSAQPAGTSFLDFTLLPTLVKGSENQIDMGSLRPKKTPGAQGIPKIIAIPTTSGTASETNGASVITDTSGPMARKLIYSQPVSKAAYIILDAELCVGVPRYSTATCGMDVLTHALEAFTSNKQNEYGDAIAIGAIKLVVEYLPKLMADLKNVDYRGKLHLASHMAGVAFNISSLGICHAMGHPLSAVLHQAHGQTLATMLPHIMAFNLDSRAAKYAEIAKAFGVHDPAKSEKDNGQAAIVAIADLSKMVGTARSIEDMGGSESQIEQLTSQALTDLTMMTTARTPTRAECAAMYRAALRNDELYPRQHSSPSKL